MAPVIHPIMYPMKATLALLALVLLIGCATTSKPPSAMPGSPA
jgi:outer membrane biogenesis lipoprotein LolB